MNLPDRHIRDLTDRLAYGSHSFALYRLPQTDECRFICQTSGEVEQPADLRGLNGKQGFVMAPFRQSGEHPLVLIRPDIVACGWNEIDQALSSPVFGEAERGSCDIRKKPSTVISEDDGKLQYAKVFERFIMPLREKRFQKLVLSRSVTLHINDAFSLSDAFVRACNSYPRMMIYLCHTSVSGTWMGCTPEILLSGQGREWHTVALAGTMPMQDEVMPTQWSRKNKEEQGYVADYVRRTIENFGDGVTEEGPYTARAGQVVHLKTDFRFCLEHTDELGSLLQELHPTPAVCGLPKKEAFRFIRDNEGYDRRYYSGFVGWLNPGGQTDLYVNLRCMELASGEATLYAGGGILALSEAEQEWEETGEKLKTIRNILHV